VEVRVELPSQHEAVALADRLQAEGRPVIRPLEVPASSGQNDEDDAQTRTWQGNKAGKEQATRVM